MRSLNSVSVFLQTRYGDCWALQDAASPNYRTTDLLYFYDVLVHSDRPIEFLAAVCNSSSKYICFQTPTRDQGFDRDRSTKKVIGWKMNVRCRG